MIDHIVSGDSQSNLLLFPQCFHPQTSLVSTFFTARYGIGCGLKKKLICFQTNHVYILKLAYCFLSLPPHLLILNDYFVGQAILDPSSVLDKRWWWWGVAMLVHESFSKSLTDKSLEAVKPCLFDLYLLDLCPSCVHPDLWR